MVVKKVILYSLLAGLVGLLVFGAVNRTLARGDESGGAKQGIQRNYQSSESASGSVNQNENQNKYQSEVYRQGQGSSGNFQSEANEDHQPLGEGTGYGAGSGGGNQRGGNGSSNHTGNSGVGQAQVTDTLAIEGIVVSVDQNTLVLEISDGESIEITNRGWRYAVEFGFTAQVGDQLSVTGFYESEDRFEAISIENLTNGQFISLREETGRPLWAGDGRGRGRKP
jgi:hypothetical protein